MYRLIKKITCIALPTLIITTNSHAASFDDWGISMMDIRGAGPNPIMEVSSANGKVYNQAANKEMEFKIEAKARCENLHWVKEGLLLIRPKNPQQFSDYHAKKVVIGKANMNKKTWANDWTPHTLKVNPDDKLKNYAIKACNTELNNRVGQGGNKEDIFKNGFETTMNKTDNQFIFTCGGFSPWAGHPKNVKNNHPITVKCGTYTPKYATIVPSALPSFKLVGADISMSQTNYQGSCPVDLPVRATITTNSFGGKFEYRFLEDGKVVSGWKQRNIAKGVSSTLLTHTITIKPTVAQAPKNPLGFQGGIQNNNQGNAQVIPQLQQVPKRKVSVQVRHNEQQMSDIQLYQATCKSAKITKATIKPLPARSNASLALPDLTSRTGITIGSKSSPWGGSLILSKADAVSADARSCKFRFKYDVVNIGKANSGNATNLLRKQGNVLHTANNFSVAKNQSRNVSGHIMLQPGSYSVMATLDHAKAVAELKENNNIFKVMVEVGKDCAASTSKPSPITATSTPERPSSTTPTRPSTPRAIPARSSSSTRSSAPR